MRKKEQIKEELWCQALVNGHTMRYRALGGSMSPFIKNGSILTIKPGGRAFIGDVILYRSGNGMIAHRVIRRKDFDEGTFLVTKGDNLRHPDALVTPSDILGKVVRMESNGKEIQLQKDSFYPWLYSIGDIPFNKGIRKNLAIRPNMGHLVWDYIHNGNDRGSRGQ